MSINDERIGGWVQLALKNEDLIDYNIEVHGTGNKGDGNIGNIFFVTVSGKTTTGQTKSLDLVIKVSKESKILREQAPVKEAFEKEIYVYDRVVTTFDAFQKEIGTEDFLHFMPKCYATHVANGVELLILENLKTKGYGMWYKTIPMTDAHVRLILQAYGKWHALSLALKARKRDIFDKLIKNNVNLFGYFVSKVNMIKLMLDIFITSRDVCVSKDDVEALDKLQFTTDDAKYIFTDLLSEDPDYQVILHGDCWNNNFMFKLQEDTKQPTAVHIIDWQCSGLGSPVMDLSHFIYTCNDTGSDKDVGKLLKIYHESLSQCLNHLGCDADEVFSYNKLIEHWKKFSRYGLILQAYALKCSMCKVDETPDYAEAAERGKDFVENFDFEVANEGVYFKRTTDNIQHYLHNLKLLE